MSPFTRRGGDLTASFERAEADILAQLATDVQALLSDADGVDPDSPSFRAINRLLPAAYRDGGENDAEFHRFTSEGLIERKARNAQAVVDVFAAGDEAGQTVRVRLDAAAAQSWLRCLTDIRLTIAAGLGIEHDDDELRIDGPDRSVLEVYAWVGYVQESLLHALEAHVV